MMSPLQHHTCQIGVHAYLTLPLHQQAAPIGPPSLSGFWSAVRFQAFQNLVFGLTAVYVDTGFPGIDMQRGACHVDCTLNRGEAYLTPTWLMQREQRLAQVKVNQSINCHCSITHARLALVILDVATAPNSGWYRYCNITHAGLALYKTKYILDIGTAPGSQLPLQHHTCQIGLVFNVT